MAVVLYKSINKTVNTIAERNALPYKIDHMVVTVLDAIADPNAGAGIATYRYNEGLADWILISRSSIDSIQFKTEEILISSGQVTATNIPSNGEIWGIKVIDGDIIMAEPRIEDLIIIGGTISGLNAYNGYDLRFTYSHGTITSQITDYVDAKLGEFVGSAPASLDTIEELASAVQSLQTGTLENVGTINDFEGAML